MANEALAYGFALGIVSLILLFIASIILIGNPESVHPAAIAGMMTGAGIMSGLGILTSAFSFLDGSSTSRIVAILLNLGILITVLIMVL